jgi:limonene-1,2-epoxide hydrolase
MASHPFREAVERRDYDAMVAALAPEVLFHSPVAFRPFAGREAVAQLFSALIENFEDFRYTDELAEGSTTALIFRARVGDKAVQGLDLLRTNDAGEIEEFTVMLRPLSAIVALGERMAPHVEGLAKGEAPSAA